MEQFNLDTWLQDKSRKVTTRLGNREVRIICYDRKNNNNKPIITLMIDPDGNEYTTFHTKNGFVDETEKYIDKRDLFFADEEEELTEFEKDLQIIISEASHWISDDGSISTYCQFGNREIKKISVQVLDLARKQIRKEQQEKLGTKCIYNRTLEERKKFCKYCSAACSVRIEEEPASKDLEEEVSNWRHNHFHDRRDKDTSGEYLERESQLDLARHFAEWGRKQMMKDAVDGQVVYQIGSAEIAPTDIRYKVVSDRVYIPNVKLGDKVKIIIIKED